MPKARGTSRRSTARLVLISKRIAGLILHDEASVTTPGPALVVCCEDDADELHRRLIE